MATFMNPTRLRQITGFTSRPDLPPYKSTLIMRWMIEEATGRPVNYWVVAENHASAEQTAAE